MDSKRQTCIALGPSGTCKTHAALALGLAACQKGYSVAFTNRCCSRSPTHGSPRRGRRLRALQKHLNTVKPPIVDGPATCSFHGGWFGIALQVFSQRYELGATLVTDNLPFDEWTTVFGSQRLPARCSTA